MKKQKGLRNQHNRAKKKEQAVAFRSPIHRARAAASAFGVSHSMMTRDIFDIGIGHVILGRTISPTTIATGIFLVDVYCLGIKNASYAERTHEQLRELMGDAPFIDIAPECARKIVDGAIVYAKKCGLVPHPDYAPAGALFGDIDAGVCRTDYEFGQNGKPLYVSGPNDTPAKIRKTIRTLIAKVGEGTFDFLVESGSF